VNFTSTAEDQTSDILLISAVWKMGSLDVKKMAEMKRKVLSTYVVRPIIMSCIMRIFSPSQNSEDYNV